MTVTWADAVHPFRLPVKVYVVVETGMAVTLKPVEELSEAAGLHKNELAPDAVSKVFCPLQMETFGEIINIGNGLTVTVTCEVAVHPSKSPVTV